MSYIKTNWLDRAVQYPQRFTRTSDGTYDTLVPAPGTVTQSGTPITAAALNNLETQYDQAVTDLKITSGSSVNGYYVKYPDGTMICYFTKNGTSNGGVYYSQDGVVFPATFLETSPIIVMITGYNSYHGYTQNNVNRQFATALSGSAVRWGVEFLGVVPSGYNVAANMIAIGRWK